MGASVIEPSQFMPKSVPELISAQAAAKLDEVAIVSSSEYVSYRDLIARANCWAHYLRSMRVGPGVTVGLCLDRTPAMVISALAILKAGGAYVPLAPTNPPSRLEWMLQDAGAAFLFTESRTDAKLSSGCWRTLDSNDPLVLSNFPSDDPEWHIGSDTLAYVIYTSGSTGTPKGVEITHRSLSNLVCWHKRAFSVSPEDRASHVSNLGFDAAVWELWPYLSCGASVFLVDEETRLSPESLQKWLVANGITISFLPTPLAERAMILSWPPETTLRILLTGGDVLHQYPSPSLPFTVVNNYGPTECAVVATSARVAVEPRPDVLPPIGCPIDNTQVYIVDENLKPVSFGATGELCISGAGLARGYINAPKLTAEKFVPDPFSHAPGARLYRTGDLCRYLPDGQIAFLGRVDSQVKIRGCRIEPAEITRALALDPQIQSSIIVAREDAHANQRLIAYIVPKPGYLPNESRLRNLLLEHLPHYMLPDIFVRLDQVPMNANGKIDLGALPAPDAANFLYSQDYVPPKTSTEQRVAALIADLLNLPTIGVTDNFFLLGGNSLLGAQMVARIHEKFGVEFKLLALFDHPTVAGISAEIERSLPTEREAMSALESERLTALFAEQRGA